MIPRPEKILAPWDFVASRRAQPGVVLGFAEAARDAGHRDYTTALRAMASLYHSALSLGVRFWVLKST